MSQRNFLRSCLILIALLPCGLHAAEPLTGEAHTTFAEDGTWCWFSDPRAVYREGKIYAGWMNSEGSVQVGVRGAKDATAQVATLAEKFERDDHDDPALLFLPDHRLMVFYSQHAKGDMHLRITTRPLDVSEWTPDRTLSFQTEGPRGVTYANPALLAAEKNALYVFWRGSDFKPTFSISPDLGQTWSAPQTLIKPAGSTNDNRPYLKAWNDGQGRIDFVFTDGHPRDEPKNSVYFLRYEKGGFWKADGTWIGALSDLPFTPAQCDRIYDGSTDGRAWIWDLAEDAQHRPVLLYTRLPTEQDHRYRYARWDGKAWLDHEITPGGKWFPETPAGKKEPEPHYSGGMNLDPQNPATVFLARPVNGTFEIERWTTPDDGATWQTTPITAHSKANNVRPFVVRNAPSGAAPLLLWMNNASGYQHYTKYHTALKFTAPEK